MTLKVIHLEIATTKKIWLLVFRQFAKLREIKEKYTKDGCNGQSSSGRAIAAGMTCSYSSPWHGTGCRSSCWRQPPPNVSIVIALVRTAAPYLAIHQFESTSRLKELLEVFTSFCFVCSGEKKTPESNHSQPPKTVSNLKIQRVDGHLFQSRAYCFFL